MGADLPLTEESARKSARDTFPQFLPEPLVFVEIPEPHHGGVERNKEALREGRMGKQLGNRDLPGQLRHPVVRQDERSDVPELSQEPARTRPTSSSVELNTAQDG